MQSDERDRVLDCRIAWLRLSLAFVTLRLLEIKAGFRQDQPRDSDGRWSGGGGSFVVTRKDKTGDSRIDTKTDEILDVLKEVVESTDIVLGAIKSALDRAGIGVPYPTQQIVISPRPAADHSNLEGA